MKRLLFVCVLVFFITFPVFSQSLTKADRDKAMQYLESTKQGVLNATAGLSQAQWNFKPGPDRWSVAEVTEHLAAAETYLRNVVVDEVMKAPPRSDGEDVTAIDEMIVKMIPDRSTKADAPAPLRPTNRFGSGPRALKALMESRGKTESFLGSHDDLRGHAMDGPIGSKMDAYEWILFIAAHNERHIKQIMEVKADSDFPKNHPKK